VVEELEAGPAPKASDLDGFPRRYLGVVSTCPGRRSYRVGWLGRSGEAGWLPSWASAQQGRASQGPLRCRVGGLGVSSALIILLQLKEVGIG
jgi:hypothetical protein